MARPDLRLGTAVTMIEARVVVDGAHVKLDARLLVPVHGPGLLLIRVAHEGRVPRAW